MGIKCEGIRALQQSSIVPFDKLSAGSAQHQDLTPIIKHLFWWVPEKEIASLSPDAIVESVLSNGNEDTVRQLFDYYGNAETPPLISSSSGGL